jgi:glycosyltransferase involved in cell wall biosynthesis
MACRGRRPRVLHVGKFYPPYMGGIETHMQALCVELRKFVDLQVIVASGNRCGAEEVLEGVPVSRLASAATMFSTPVCPSMVARLRGSDADLVHIHLPNPAALAAYMASGHRGHLVLTYHSDIVRQKLLGWLFEPVLHAALRRSSAILVTSPNYLETSSVLRAHRERCHVVPYGIDLDRFRHCESADVTRIREGYGSRLVVSIGRLVYYKGFEHLIAAMKQVRGKLLIIGDGPLRGRLQALITEMGVVEKVFLAGGVQNQSIVPFYHACDVFALASVARSEAFGIVQIEAMAAGLPVVNTRLDSGVPFVSLHGQTGLTVPPGDSEALAAAINRLLDDAELRRSLGQAGRLRAEREFSLGTMVSRTLAIYDGLMIDGATTFAAPLEQASLSPTIAETCHD